MTLDDPLEGLLACHTRIRRLASALRRLPGVEDLRGPMVATSASQMARYLREALPKHGQDEDESLAPRLRAVGVSLEVDAALTRMHEEHQQMDRLLPPLLTELDRLVNRDPGDPAVLNQLGQELARLLTDHVELEERVVFPAIGRLPLRARSAMRGEMLRRRM